MIKQNAIQLSPTMSALTITQVVQAAHDIRSPLAVLGMLFHSIEQKLPEQERNLLQMALHQINHIADDLVYKYKGKGSTSVEKILVYDAMKEIILEKKLEYHNHKISFEFKRAKPELTSILVEGSYIEIKRVFSNLVNNAVNAMSDGGIIQVIFEHQVNQVQIKICDQGSGLSQKRIQQLLSVDLDQEAGIGLGLKHAKQYVQQYKGHLMIDSEIGSGTVVTLSFPTLRH